MDTPRHFATPSPRFSQHFRTPCVFVIAALCAVTILAVVLLPVPARAGATRPAATPTLPERCGLNVALVLDLSSSISDADLRDSKRAASAVVDGLRGTPSSVGLYTFASYAPDRSNLPLDSTAVTTRAGAQKVHLAIDDLTRVPAAMGGTNWDRGLAQVGSGYDLVLFVTDGKPTAYGTPRTKGNPDRGASTEPIDVQEAVKSANALKSGGTRIEAIGVGAGPDTDNLARVSGPRRSADYYLIGDYGDLSGRLKESALQSCHGTVTVSSLERRGGGQPVPASGWRYRAPGGTPARVTTGEGGTATISYGKGAHVKIRSGTKREFTLQPQNGKNATCTDDNESPVPVSNVGKLGFRLQKPLSRTDVVKCSVEYAANQPTPTPSTPEPSGDPTSGPSKSPTASPSETPSSGPSQPDDPCPTVPGSNDPGREDGTGSIAWCLLDMGSTNPHDPVWLLPDSRWKLTGPDGSYALVTDNGLNDFDPARGRIRVGRLAEGEYSLQQVHAPADYVLPPCASPIKIDSATSSSGFQYRQIFNIPGEQGKTQDTGSCSSATTTPSP